MKSRDWKSVPLRHWKRAGFDQPTWIDSETLRVPRPPRAGRWAGWPPRTGTPSGRSTPCAAGRPALTAGSAGPRPPCRPGLPVPVPSALHHATQYTGHHASEELRRHELLGGPDPRGGGRVVDHADRPGLLPRGHPVRRLPPAARHLPQHPHRPARPPGRARRPGAGSLPGAPGALRLPPHRQGPGPVAGAHGPAPVGRSVGGGRGTPRGRSSTRRAATRPPWCPPARRAASTLDARSVRALAGPGSKNRPADEILLPSGGG